MEQTHSIPARAPAVPVVYLEISSPEAIDSVEVTFWPDYLTQHGTIPDPIKTEIPTFAGNLFDGSIETARIQWDGLSIDKPGRLSIRYDRFVYLDRFLVYPGDSVRIRLDLSRGSAIFAGPSADRFRCQYELAQAWESWRFAQDPVMFTPQPDMFKAEGVDTVLLASAIQNQSSIRRMMRFINPGEPTAEYIKEKFEADRKTHPGWKVIESYKGILEPEFLETMESDLEGRILFELTNLVKTAYRDIPAFRNLFENHLLTLPENLENPEIISQSIFYLDYLYTKNAVVSAIERKSFRTLLEQYNGEVHDLIYGRYLINNYRGFSNVNRQFDLAMASITTPWILEGIRQLALSQKIGSPISDIPLTDSKGQEVSLTNLKGKILLMDFWFTGCQACVLFYRDYLTPIEHHFSGDERLMIVSISADKDRDKWAKSISSGKYTSEHALNLLTEGMDHPFLNMYQIHYYPTQMLVDSDGNVVRIGNFPDSPEELIVLIESMMEDPAVEEPE
jgi:hypothetical protein